MPIRRSGVLSSNMLGFPVRQKLRPVIAKPACRWQPPTVACEHRGMALTPSRRGLIPPFIAMDMLRAANEREAAGHKVIHLEVGQPGTPAPAAVLAAARAALADDRIGY